MAGGIHPNYYRLAELHQKLQKKQLTSMESVEWRHILDWNLTECWKDITKANCFNAADAVGDIEWMHAIAAEDETEGGENYSRSNSDSSNNPVPDQRGSSESAEECTTKATPASGRTVLHTNDSQIIEDLGDEIRQLMMENGFSPGPARDVAGQIMDIVISKWY